MAVHSELISTNAGPFAIRDFGGRGPDLLFVHGTGHNLEVWSPLLQALRGSFRMVAFDMRGHGQTPAQSTGPEQYWRDIEVLMAALGLRQPLLVGHSTGGYAVSAHAASGGTCGGIVVLDGFTLDGRKTPEELKGGTCRANSSGGFSRMAGWPAPKRSSATSTMCAARHRTTG